MQELYIIRCGDSDLFKIGISKYPEKRLKQLQTGNPHILKILFTFKVSEKYKNIEAQKIEHTWKQQKSTENKNTLKNTTSADTPKTENQTKPRHKNNKQGKQKRERANNRKNDNTNTYESNADNMASGGHSDVLVPIFETTWFLAGIATFYYQPLRQHGFWWT